MTRTADAGNVHESAAAAESAQETAEMVAAAMLAHETAKTKPTFPALGIATTAQSEVQTSKTLDQCLTRARTHFAGSTRSTYLLAMELDQIFTQRLWLLRMGRDKKPVYTKPDQFIDKELPKIPKTTLYRLAEAGRTAREHCITEELFTKIGVTAVAILHHVKDDDEFRDVFPKVLHGELTTRQLDNLLRPKKPAPPPPPELPPVPAPRPSATGDIPSAGNETSEAEKEWAKAAAARVNAMVGDGKDLKPQVALCALPVSFTKKILVLVGQETTWQEESIDGECVITHKLVKVRRTGKKAITYRYERYIATPGKEDATDDTTGDESP